MLTRRVLLSGAATAGLSTPIAGCANLKELQPDCAISWAPSFQYPVFYGYKDYVTGGPPVLARARPGTVPGAGTIALGPPGNIRVYYPSLEGSPAGAAILDRCERYPLVLFIHGDCGGNPYAQWI